MAFPSGLEVAVGPPWWSRASRIEPTGYLTDVLPRIRDATSDADLDQLLPDRRIPLAPEG